MSDRTLRFSKISNAPQRGFSLIEMLLVVAILTVVVAIVVSGAIQLQQRNATETDKVDLTQETRQFMDQVVKDLHHAGYPNKKMFDVATSTANPNNYAVGLTHVDTTSITFEGDVDGSGNVSQVTVQLIPAGGPCPCKLQRATIVKGSGLPPKYYTEVDNVLNTDIFTAYDNTGSQLTLPCDNASSTPCLGLNIKTIGLKVNLQSNSLDPTDKSYTNVTMHTEAKINN